MKETVLILGLVVAVGTVTAQGAAADPAPDVAPQMSVDLDPVLDDRVNCEEAASGEGTCVPLVLGCYLCLDTLTIHCPV